MFNIQPCREDLKSLDHSSGRRKEKKKARQEDWGRGSDGNPLQDKTFHLGSGVKVRTTRQQMLGATGRHWIY